MRFPKSMLEANGFSPPDDGSRELVKLLVAWPSNGVECFETVFANYYPNDRRAEVYLGRLDRGTGDQFKVNGATRYGLEGFVEDFNGNRPLNLENMKLGTDGRVLWMDVDGRRVHLSDFEMATFGSLVNLRARIGKKETEIKFEFDGKSAAARFKGHPLIEFMQVHGDELEIRYAQSKEEKHVHWMSLKSDGTRA